MGAKAGGGPAARWTIRRAAALVGALILAATFAAACHGAPGPLSVQIDPVQGLADEPVSIRITGLDRAERVQLRTDATDYLGQPWRAEATFVADGDGVVDLAHRQPVETSYDGSDPMALFWGMDPVGAPANETGFDPLYPELQAAFDVVLTLTRSDQTTYQQPLRREWTAEGVTHRRLDIATDGVAGDLFLPGPGAAGPGVLLIGGSEGGPGPKFQAALLASHGHAALAVSYFGGPGLPAALRDIAIEYFIRAVHLLPGPGPQHLFAYSRGTEAALLLAGLYPSLVRSAVVFAPSDEVWPAYPPPGSAWTHAGTPEISVPWKTIQAPVLAVAGGDDRLWPSEASANAIGQGTRGHVLIYPDAGHALGLPPYLPKATRIVHPVTGDALNLGGTRAADAAARAESWRAMLDFLAES